MVVAAYDTEQDYALYGGDVSYLRLEQGMFAIFFPEDLHMPGIDHVASPVIKVVVKVKVE